MPTLADFTMNDLAGQPVPLARHAGQVLLVVNTASQCGFTPQYEGLEALHRALSPRGFAVLGFPCNQFGAQEPGDAAEIASFCRTRYDVSFPLFAKVAVNGPQAAPLYQWLKREARGLFGTTAIKWNFTKFLLDRQGRVTGRFGPSTKPAALRGRIEALL